ncbi:putative protein kinase RLK-Pelle-LRR-I-1 family [Helianthus anomalus]
MIASNSYYNLYRAELYHYDIENPSSAKGENKGKHPERQNIVTIKRFLTNRRDEMFFTSIDMLTSVKHRNIVTLLGLCVEDLEMILITENFCNGYLEDYLININNRHILTWEKRLKICIDIAHALKYLHYEVEDPKKITNRDICSYTIGLDENWGAKIVEFGNSVLLNEIRSIHLNIVAKKCYIDPQVGRKGNITRKSDVYSLGVVLFEILSGTVAYDPIYFNEGLANHARTSFHAGTLDDMIDPKIKDDIGENSFILNRGPNKNSLKTFIKIALDCVEKTTKQRPTIEVVVKELEKALYFQENNDHKISLEKIKHATQNFHNDHYIGGGGFGRVYKGNLQDGDESKIVAVKRLDPRHGQGEQQFLSELQILLEYKHENIIGLVGYCDEEDEKIIVYEYASGGSLDKYLNNDSLSWEKRLYICIEVARALDFLHGGEGEQAKVVHRDIKTANILLSHDGKAKLADFGLSLISTITHETDVVVDNVCGTPGYLDPLYRESKFLTIESDIYSFGVVLFEMLYGRSTFAIHKHEGRYLPDFIKSKFEEGKLDEVVFEQIKERIVQQSLTTFQKIAYQCLQHERENRPTTKTVLAKLMKSLKFQNPKSLKLQHNIIEEAIFEYASLLHS